MIMNNVNVKASWMNSEGRINNLDIDHANVTLDNSMLMIEARDNSIICIANDLLADKVRITRIPDEKE